MDTLTVTGLKIKTTIGCLDWEKVIMQPLLLDFQIHYDNTVPGQSDALHDAFDYDALSAQIRAKMILEKNNLIETVAEKLASWLLEDGRIKELRLTVHKKNAIADCQDISVSITRTRPHAFLE